VTTITAPPSGGCAHDPAESRMLAQGRFAIQRYGGPREELRFDGQDQR